MITISIIIPTHRRFKEFIDCLDSIAHQDYDMKSVEVIAIHDGKPSNYDKTIINDTSSKLSNFSFKEVEHIGVGMTRNLCAQKAVGKYLVMIDDDCVAEEGWLKNLIQFMETNQETLACQGQVIPFPPKTFIEKYISFKNLMRNPVRDIDGNVSNVMTSNCCYRKEVFDKVGGFREDFLKWGGEDLELNLRVRKLGKLGFCETAVVKHKHRRTLWAMTKQHFHYGRGGYLACKINNVPYESLRFYKPTILNLLRYFFYTLKRIFTVSIPEFKEKNLNLLMYPPYIFLDIIRKNTYQLGATYQYYFGRN